MSTHNIFFHGKIRKYQNSLLKKMYLELCSLLLKFIEYLEFNTYKMYHTNDYGQIQQMIH